MSRRGVKLAVIAAAAVALTGTIGATAWAETVTPGVEQPIFDLGAPNSLLGGQALPETAGGNYSSAEGRNGKDFRGRSGGPTGQQAQTVQPYDSGSPFDDVEDNGYWRGSGDDYSSSDDADGSFSG